MERGKINAALTKMEVDGGQNAILFDASMGEHSFFVRYPLAEDQSIPVLNIVGPKPNISVSRLSKAFVSGATGPTSFSQVAGGFFEYMNATRPGLKVLMAPRVAIPAPMTPYGAVKPQAAGWEGTFSDGDGNWWVRVPFAVCPMENLIVVATQDGPTSVMFNALCAAIEIGLSTMTNKELSGVYSDAEALMQKSGPLAVGDLFHVSMREAFVKVAAAQELGLLLGFHCYRDPADSEEDYSSSEKTIFKIVTGQTVGTGGWQTSNRSIS